jgi:hypothetical protein
MQRLFVPVSVVLLASACGTPAPETSEAEITRATARADDAMLALQTRLIEALTTELEKNGATGAIHVCRDAAPAITSAVSSEQGVTVARTSHRLRNPDNVPPDWAREIVERGAGTQFEDATEHVIDLGDRVGVLRPIGTLGMCTTCHGDEAAMGPELRELIAESYPDDEATGFEVGDLRGWLWAEVPRGE